MKHQKILNLLNESSELGIITRIWNTVKDHSITNYDIGNKIIYNTE